jgi:hypothetical protein
MMTKEEFNEGIKALLLDASDEESEFTEFMTDLNEIEIELEEHDEELARRVGNIRIAINDLVAYVQERGEHK